MNLINCVGVARITNILRVAGQSYVQFGEQKKTKEIGQCVD